MSLQKVADYLSEALIRTSYSGVTVETFSIRPNLYIDGLKLHGVKKMFEARDIMNDFDSTPVWKGVRFLLPHDYHLPSIVDDVAPLISSEAKHHVAEMRTLYSKHMEIMSEELAANINSWTSKAINGGIESIINNIREVFKVNGIQESEDDIRRRVIETVVILPIQTS